MRWPELQTSTVPWVGTGVLWFRRDQLVHPAAAYVTNTVRPC
jgi:hypothetical protein